jgi:hypothetical protein
MEIVDDHSKIILDVITMIPQKYIKKLDQATHLNAFHNWMR